MIKPRSNFLLSLVKRLSGEYKSILIDYRPDPVARYGYGLPAHKQLFQLIDARRPDYLELLEKFGDFAGKLAKIPLEPSAERTMPHWNNSYLGGTNAVALYCFPALQKSNVYIEVGSGNSTKFIRKSVEDNQTGTKIISIDPQPRSDIDDICDERVRGKLEETDLSVFNDLGRGDILFFDGSHRCFQNSDVTVFFLEVLPRLKPGVIIYIDDVYIPYDYPPEWADRWYSEQYLLAAFLLADQAQRYSVLLPHVFVERDPELAAREHLLWEKIGYRTRSGNGIWIVIKDHQ